MAAARARGELDYDLFKDSVPADNNLLFESLLRVWGIADRKVQAVVTDHGSASAANSAGLADFETLDATCLRKPEDLKKKMEDKEFARGATPARAKPKGGSPS